MQDKRKIKMIISLIVIALSIILIVVVNIKTDSSKKIEESVEKQQEKVTDTIKDMLEKNDVFNYAKNNKVSRYSISDLRNKLKIDTSEFNKLYYGCNPNTTFVVFNDDYTDYTLYMDCTNFYEEEALNENE